MACDIPGHRVLNCIIEGQVKVLVNLWFGHVHLIPSASMHPHAESEGFVDLII